VDLKISKKKLFINLWKYKDIKLIIKGKDLITQLPFWALIKRGKKGIIRIRKLSNGGNLIKERWELMVKSKVNIVRNLQLRTC
jgi:hypothetical protein